jgi:hypothetical protein
MNLLSLVGPRLDNIFQIKRKRYYSSGSNFLQSKQGPTLTYMIGLTAITLAQTVELVSLFYIDRGYILHIRDNDCGYHLTCVISLKQYTPCV